MHCQCKYWGVEMWDDLCGFTSKSTIKKTERRCKDFDTSPNFFVLCSGEWVSSLLLTVWMLGSGLGICFYNMKYFLKEPFSGRESTCFHLCPASPSPMQLPVFSSISILYILGDIVSNKLSLPFSQDKGCAFSLPSYHFKSTLKSSSTCKCL